MTHPAARVVVVGLGPAGAELAPQAALAAVAGHPPARRWARTDRHPAVSLLGEHRSFDHVYDGAEHLEDVYPAIVDTLLCEARLHGSVCYAVPGSPLVAELTVELLRAVGASGVVTVEIIPALSFLDLAWDRLSVDPLAAGVRLVDGHRFGVESAGERGPLLVAQCDTTDVLSDVKLAVEEAPAAPVIVLQGLGTPEERVYEVAWADLDRAVTADHLTTLWIPTLGAPVATELARLQELVASLRRQCPWDRAQTHDSLRPYVVEEAYEVVDAILALGQPGGGSGDGSGESTSNRPDPPAAAAVDALEEELGDLLFQVVLHAAIAGEAGWFDLSDVARTVHDKLWRRHPHVFGPTAGSAELGALRGAWDRMKAVEKGRKSTFDGIPESFPARLYAQKVTARASRIDLPVDLSTELAALDAAEAALRGAARSAMEAGRVYEQRGGGG